MSSGSGGDGFSFTIPKKIPKKQRHSNPSTGSSLIAAPPLNSRSSSFTPPPSSNARPPLLKKSRSMGNSSHSRDHRDYKDNKEYKDYKDRRDYRERKERRDYREYREHREHREHREYREHKERKESAPSPPPSEPVSAIQIKSLEPFLIKIKLDGVPLNNGGIPSSFRKRSLSPPPAAPELNTSISPRGSGSGGSLRSSFRTPNKKRKTYSEELEDTDSDDLMTSGEEEAAEKRRIKRVAKKKEKKTKTPFEDDDEDEEEEAATLKEAPSSSNLALMNQAEVNIDGASIYEIEAPPPGTLHCLWYSRESFLHVFVIEKILGWKTRPLVKLERQVSPDDDDDDELSDDIPLIAARNKNVHMLELDEALKLKDKAIVETSNDFRKRMEISRINPVGCPYIKQLASSKEAVSSQKQGKTPGFKAVQSEKDREEVYLIKWRGRSFMHCSWERKRDLEKFDHSTQPGAARGKINRYIQSQVLTLGKDWKQVLEAGRRAAATPSHSHHSQAPGNDADPAATAPGANENRKEDTPEEEDFFSPLYLEVERILGCDESELDLKVLARQRALNLRSERDALKKREREDAEEEKWLKGENGEQSTDEVAKSGKKEGTVADKDEEKEWDPEDNVRYVVKWKGLQLTDATWEYWLDIKRDFVDEVEDFWLRQKMPSNEEVKEISGAPHPHPKDFKKLTESPVFGVSSIERPVAKLGDGQDDCVLNDTDASGVVMKLRAYQLEGVNWLLWNWYNRRSCILADEMGLGKTIQSIGFLHELQRLRQVKVRGPFLVVAPLSLVSQWESESREWAPDMNVVVYHGSADAREFLVQQEFYFTDQFTSKTAALSLKRKHITKFHVLITTYEVVLKDVSVLSKIYWKALIVDEAHRLKNIKSRLFEDLAAVPRDFCLLLTGTPLQNSTEELWALLHFCDPASFDSKEDFTEKFGQLTDSDQVANLHSVLRPYLLRRVKEDVEKALPPKEETILEVALTPIQKTFYKAIYEKNTSFLFKGAKPSNAPSLMNVMMELRKCCNHPFLIRGAEERIIGDAAAAELKALSADKNNLPQESSSLIDYAKLTGEQLLKSSGKFVLLSKLLPKLHNGGHKVLIFSQMVRVLDLLQELLQLKHYRYERLDGSTSASARNAAVDRFRRESFQRFVMLLSTRAGGLGLNLTAADTVIIFDSDWNPQNDLQAMARAHRIGQTRSVRVYRLLTAKTYEMHMFHSASLKLGLDRAVLAHQRQNANSDEGSSKKKSKAEREEQAKEIDELLKKGAYDVFRDDDDNEAQKFMETDIDQLLEQSSRKVTYGETATSALSSGLGSFSKASFVASTGDADGKDVDLDDPDFWAKAVGLDVPPEDIDPTMMLIVDEGSKRNRKQVQAFDPQADLAEAERKRKELIAIKKKEEKEEKERARLQKKQKKEAEREAKEKRRKEAAELKEKQKENKIKVTVSDKEKKNQQEKKAKIIQTDKDKKVKEVRIIFNERKTDRKRAMRRAEREDPVFERVKQAWDTTQRNRVVNAILRFGFGRFCKVRQESNFTSLPIQDIEVFARTYIYQLGLQAAASFLSKIDPGIASNEDMDKITQESLHKALASTVNEGKDFDWMCEAILSSLCMHMRVMAHDAFVRIPLILAEPSFVFELRHGTAVRSLHRLAFLSRLISVVEEAVDRIIMDLGYEEMGKRGCPTNDYSTLDLDLKARHVSIEEILHALGVNLLSSNVGCTMASDSFLSCAPWWDRSCDLGLVIGTFIHGLGNYEAMRNDDELPFINRINIYAERNQPAAECSRRFEIAAAAAKNIFDTALLTMKRKFQQQTHAAVAAVFAATKMAEKQDVSAEKESAFDPKSAYLAKAQKIDQDDIITLSRLKEAVTKAFRGRCDQSVNFGVTNERSGKSSLSRDQNSSSHCALPLPDANHLDHLLVQIVNNIEGNKRTNKPIKNGSQGRANRTIPRHQISQLDENPEDDMILKNTAILNQVDVLFYGSTKDNRANRHKWRRISFAGSLSSTVTKPQDDCADYFLGAASPELASVAVGADASRYQRGSCVPLIVTRFGLGAILQADDAVIELAAADNLTKSESADDEGKSNQQLNSAASANDATTVTSSSAIAGQPELIEKPIWQFIKDNVALRASLSSILLNCGSPLSTRSSEFCQVHSDLIEEFHQNPSLSHFSFNEKITFFSLEDFLNASRFATLDLPEELEPVEEYFNSILLPHCLRLCLMLSGEQAKIASSQGRHDVYAARPSYEKLSPLPDPFISFENHSEEAVAHAYAIMRRYKLMKSIRFIVGGGIPCDELLNFLRSPHMRNQTSGVPVWWCPWLHDLGLIVHAAVHGLASVATELHQLLRPTIIRHIREVFIDGLNGRKPALPQSVLVNASEEELDAWVEAHSSQFPKPNIIEHRLAFMCSHLTANTIAQYDNVPMFDEGGWPMVEDLKANGFIGDTKSIGASCLLCDAEG